ncbi:hypothetical protein CPB84DRAFT_53434 [Gymnopilus junonius]|uniref:Cytochrome P450 n=1 Tax=Gymnopilus junonius TaxID=109634 RepID=A0A9P5P1Y1_GYMJU|nr:hypothetical protein CPB84DRAFT_53434 [Gymnopilus junonius]
MNILREIPIRLCRVDVVIVLSLVVLALRIIRRLFFHPLSSFPGPRLAAISSYYKTYYEVVKDGALLDQIDYMHAVYGPVVRVGPNELHFADYRAYFDIYSVGLHLTKDPKFYSCFGAGGSAFGAIDPYASKARRAFMHIFLSRRAVINLEPMIQQKIQRLITRLASAHEPTTFSLPFAVLHWTSSPHICSDIVWML